ncbi:Endoplasmic reticulum transmembrane protein 3 [Smittium mucronatum]|uniref:Endoplasmic reticulum transmembrane protein n=1 Tax=Smittium mucronatum TaxID=133383 RepID=A0A1R0GUW4_9FUNG|nr:Endoplasmic reticulum transmembrane protein 3 [Smittium mucronatum]
MITMFYAQRNIYLTGITLLLGLIMVSTHKLIVELLEARSKVASASKLQGVSGLAEKSAINEKQKTINTLQDKLAKLEKDLYQKEKSNVSSKNASESKQDVELDDAEVIKSQLAQSNVRRRNI